jgi:hypothetical protein
MKVSKSIFALELQTNRAFILFENHISLTKYSFTQLYKFCKMVYYSKNF